MYAKNGDTMMMKIELADGTRLANFKRTIIPLRIVLPNKLSEESPACSTPAQKQGC